MYCLAKLENNIWSCMYHNKSSSKYNTFNFDVFESGIYAIAFAPDIPFADFNEDEFCGIICKDKRLVFMYIFIGIPALVALFYLTYKM